MAYAIIKHDRYETGLTHDEREKFLMDTADDVENLPMDCAVGSIAYTADKSEGYLMSPSGVWVKVVSVNTMLEEFDFD